jgi:hypothetical protein
MPEVQNSTGTGLAAHRTEMVYFEAKSRHWLIRGLRRERV